MSAIEVVEHLNIYDNPIPNLVSRHGYFPGLAKLPSGDLLAMFPMGEAFEAAMTMHVSRSQDQGHTWALEGPMNEGLEPRKLAPGGLKPTALSDGTVIALGYGFHRDDPEISINPETGGTLPGENYVSFSSDEGRTWSMPESIPLTQPEILETSGPCVELRNGDLIAAGPPFPMWDGTMPSGRKGFLLRSHDKGKTWDSGTVYYERADLWPVECRPCEMQDGRIVMMIWCLNDTAGKSLTNHVVVSHDNGMTWSDPIDTGVPAQASNVMYLGGERLLAIHCQREGDVGLYVYVVDFSDDKWRIVGGEDIWDNAPSAHIGRLADMGLGLKFGQASLLQLDDGEILATHWAIESGQGRILAHRIRVNLEGL